MPNTRVSRSGGSGGAAVVAAAAVALIAPLAAGCGDGPICQSEVMLVIQSPSGVILDDANPDMAGVQTPVRVRTTVGAGRPVELTVLDAGGQALGTVTAMTDAQGDVTFEDVTLPAGAARLRAEVDGGACGADSDEVSITVAAGRDCALTIRETPLQIDYYAPLGVLNLSNDDDPVAPNFQANIDVATSPGYTVELFVASEGAETSAGTTDADGGGAATFALSLGQGRQALRAVCTGPGGVARPSITTTVFVDTEAPTCAMTAPAPGTTITPAHDTNGDLADGVQLALAAAVTGADTEGEDAVFVVTVDGDAQLVTGTPVDGAGATTAAATVDPASPPATATIELSSQDHAGNACSVTETYDVVYDGCAIAVTAPTGVVTQDADGDGANGAQVDVVLAVDAACAGRTVTSSCGLNSPSGTVGDDGSLTLRVDVCDTATCDVQRACTFTVSNAAGIETSAGATIHFDNLPPSVGIQLVQPAMSCGAQITPAADIDGATPGVQIRVRVISPVAADRQVEQTTSDGTQLYDANAPGGNVVVTVVLGDNDLVGIARDAHGNTARTAACRVTLQDIIVTFLPPADDGTVGAGDGVVVGTDLTFQLCGRTSVSGATVTVAVDDGPAVPATVTGTTWCRTLTLAASPPSYTIVATATSGALTGQATLVLTVDLAAPEPIADLAVIADTRQSLTATWTAPADSDGGVASGYVVKVATVPLTEGNFDTTGEQVFTASPRPPGSAESLRVAPRRTGVAYWLGVAATDAAGNRGPAAIVGPVTPVFDQSAAILPPSAAGEASFGAPIVRGRFNDDDLWDVAVAAYGVDVDGVLGAGAVYVYFGTPDGLPDTPDVVIEGETFFGALGLSMTAVRWSSTTRDDLVIGEPYNGDGRAYVFHGGAGFVPGAYRPGDADRVIGVSALPNAFSGGFLGWSLATLDFDGDGRQDLAIGAPFAADGNGVVAILYGGTVTGSVVLLSDVNSNQLGGAVVHLIRDPNGIEFDVFANYLHNVGKTFGGTDVTDDLLITYADPDTGAPVMNRVYVYRRLTTRPTTTGVYTRNFQIGNDVRIDYVSVDRTTELGSSAGSVPDLNGDGAREIVISAYRDGADAGRVMIISGRTTGTSGIATTATPGVVVTTITPATGVTLFGAGIVNNALAAAADVDGDGFEDLLITGRSGGRAQMYVWFGGSIPTGNAISSSAQHVITGPETFTGVAPGFGGTPHAAIWAGDVNGDGLADICWGDTTGNSRDGSIQLLWDDGL